MIYKFLHIIHIIGGPFDGEVHHYEDNHEFPPPVFLLREPGKVTAEAHRPGLRLDWNKSEYEYHHVSDPIMTINSIQT